MFFTATTSKDKKLDGKVERRLNFTASALNDPLSLVPPPQIQSATIISSQNSPKSPNRSPHVRSPREAFEAIRPFIRCDRKLPSSGRVSERIKAGKKTATVKEQEFS